MLTIEQAFLTGFIKAADANLIPGVGQPNLDMPNAPIQPGTVNTQQPKPNPQVAGNIPVGYALIQKLKSMKGMTPVPPPVNSQYLPQ